MPPRPKKRTDTATNRESDKIIIRLPEGMRDYLAEYAARQGMSMTQVVRHALARFFAEETTGERPTDASAWEALKNQLGNIQSTMSELRKEVTQIRKSREKKNPSP